MPKSKSQLSLLSSVIISALVCAIVSPLPASASGETLVTGSIKSVDGTPISGLNISFNTPSVPGKPRAQPTTVKTNTAGKFALMLPLGTYDASINERRTYVKKARCLATNFVYSVAGEGQSLNILVPNQKAYNIKYVSKGTNLDTPLVSTRLGRVNYNAVPNEAIGNPDFFCNGLYMRTQPVTGGFNWYAYEVAESGLSNGSFTYKSGLGQTVTQDFPGDAFVRNKAVIEISSVPTLKLIRNSVMFSNKTFTGEAIFSDLAEFKDLDLERTFKLILSWKLNTLNGVSRKTFKLTSGNRVKFSYKVTNLYSKTPTVTLVGNGFLTASNSVLIRTD